MAALATMAVATLNQLEEEQLLRLLHKKAGFSMNTLRRTFAQVRIEHGIVPTDIGMEVGKKTLESQFEKGRHLMRVRGIEYYQYTGTDWQVLSIEALRKRVMPVVLQYKGHFGNRPATNIVSEVITCIGDLVELYAPSDTPKNVINTTTGEIWLSGNGFYELKPHSFESRLFGCVPYGYDPKAKAPLYEQTMLELFAKCSNPAEVLRHWNEFLGYILQPDRFVDAVWFMLGNGENGKSTALKVIQSLLGPLVYSCDIQKFSRDNFNYRAIFGKHLIADEDFAKNLETYDAFFKKVSGKSMIGGRSPHKLDPFMFQNTAAPLLIGNHYPSCRDLSHGWRRRLHVFPFERELAKHEVDVDRFKKIESTEMPGILNLALEGYGRICQRGRKFDVPKDCLKAAEKFREQSNILLMYTKARFEKSTKSYIRLRDIKQDIVAWGQEQGMSIHSPGNSLKSDLESLGYKVGEMDGLNSVKGHRLKTDEHVH